MKWSHPNSYWGYSDFDNIICPFTLCYVGKAKNIAKVRDFNLNKLMLELSRPTVGERGREAASWVAQLHGNL